MRAPALRACGPWRSSSRCSDGGSPSSSAIGHTALGEAAAALDDLPDRDRLLSWRRRAAASLGTFDEGRPLLAQLDTIRDALGDIANGLLVARGLDPTVQPPPRREKPPLDGGAISLDQARVASMRVSSLALSSDAQLRAGIAAAFDAFADALDGESPELRGSSSSLRVDANRLRRSEPLDVETARWTKQGLLGCAAALASMPVGRTPPGGDWVARARAAASGLHEEMLVSFQRAPMQEAFRLLADTIMLSAAERSSGLARTPPAPGNGAP